MVFIFFVAVGLRFLVHFTVSREFWFAKEFYKRVHEHLDQRDFSAKDKSFYISMKVNLEKTYYELFVVRAYMKRRNPDVIMDVSDRFFFDTRRLC